MKFMCFLKGSVFLFTLNWIQGETSAFCNRSLNIQSKLLRRFLGIQFLSLSPAYFSMNTLTFMLYCSTITLPIGLIVHKSICIEPHNGRTIAWMGFCNSLPCCPGSIGLYLPLSTTAACRQIEVHVLLCSFIRLQLSVTLSEWGLVSRSVITLSVIIGFYYCKSNNCISLPAPQKCVN